MHRPVICMYIFIASLRVLLRLGMYLMLDSMTLKRSLVDSTPWPLLAEEVCRGLAAATMQYVRHRSALVVSPIASTGSTT